MVVVAAASVTIVGSGWLAVLVTATSRNAEFAICQGSRDRVFEVRESAGAHTGGMAAMSESAEPSAEEEHASFGSVPWAVQAVTADLP